MLKMIELMAIGWCAIIKLSIEKFYVGERETMVL
jgi:hypothetical protein